MNTDEIQCIMMRANIGMCRFLGVFPADQVPIDGGGGVGRRWCCVANTDPHERPGEHWVAFYFDGRVCEYFDPYGMPLQVYPALHKRLRNAAVTCQVSTAVQPPLSSTCGHYCIFFLCSRSGSSLVRIVERLLRIPMRARDSFILHHVRTLTSTLSIRRPCRDACKGSQCCTPRNDVLQ
jgi:hypothetical protein